MRKSTVAYCTNVDPNDSRITRGSVQVLRPLGCARIGNSCRGCADVFGATNTITAAGLPLIDEKAIPCTSGGVEFSKYLDDGYRILTF